VNEPNACTALEIVYPDVYTIRETGSPS